MQVRALDVSTEAAAGTSHRDAQLEPQAFRLDTGEALLLDSSSHGAYALRLEAQSGSPSRLMAVEIDAPLGK